MKFIITEIQAKSILEQQMGFEYGIEPDFLNSLCSKSKTKKSPACGLLKLRPLLNDELKQELNNKQTQVNIEHLTNGIYFYKINKNGENIKIGKVLKQ